MAHISSAESLALEELFEREHQPMVRMAALMIGSGALAEEVVQDAFAEVVKRWHSLDRPGRYLRTCVVNGCAQVLRRRETEARLSPTVAQTSAVELPTHLVEIEAALNTLTDRRRLVVVLRYFVDVPDAEIAELLGVRPATVRSLARRALVALKEELL